MCQSYILNYRISNFDFWWLGLEHEADCLFVVILLQDSSDFVEGAMEE